MDMPDVHVDDALAQPTRARLFAMLSGLADPVTTDELAQRLALHPNGIRNHLARLERAGLLTRSKQHHGPGRPSDVWTVSAQARAAARGREHAYEDLAAWLARSISPRPARLREVEATGEEIGCEQAKAERGDSGVEGVSELLTALGFRPHVENTGADSAELRLDACPYSDAVRANAPVVCALHRGMTRGIVSQLAPRCELAEFVPADPDRAGCLIELRPARNVSRGSKRR